MTFVNQIIPYLPTRVQPQHTSGQNWAISSLKADHLSRNRACEHLIKRSKHFSPNKLIMLGLHDKKQLEQNRLTKVKPKLPSFQNIKAPPHLAAIMRKRLKYLVFNIRLTSQSDE